MYRVVSKLTKPTTSIPTHQHILRRTKDRRGSRLKANRKSLFMLSGANNPNNLLINSTVCLYKYIILYIHTQIKTAVLGIALMYISTV